MASSYLTNPRPLGARIVVESIVPTVSSGATGLVTPDAVFEKAQAQVGVVQLVGPEVTKVAVGDTVVFNRGALDISHLNNMTGPKVFLLNETDCLLKFDTSALAVPTP